MQDVPCHTGMGKDGISMEGEAHNKKLYSVKDMSYFLTDITTELGIGIQAWAEGVNVCESTARWHLKAERIPDPKCWGRIAKYLKMPVTELEALFREESKSQGRILYCQVCQAEFYQFSRKRLCGSIECLRSYDRTRKASQREKTRGPAFKRLNDVDFYSTRKSPKITREALNLKVKEYIKAGGTITNLEPTIADGLEEWQEENYTAQLHLQRFKIDQVY